MIRAVLCDIEGTTSSISFVKEVLFPYARQNIRNFLEQNRDHPDIAHEIAQVIEENEDVLTLDDVIDCLIRWIDEDRKHTSLKTLQGMIWKEGFTRGDFRSHLYEDVAPALKKWHVENFKLYIYSSGSVQAQKLYFQFSDAGDLGSLFSGHFDTTIGHKREKSSYENISEAVKIPAEEILFLSDIAEELEAAQSAGMKVIRLVRPGDSLPGSRFQEVASFDQIQPEKI